MSTIRRSSALFCPFFSFSSGFSQGTLSALFHHVGLCYCIKNVPIQSSVTEIGVLLSVIFTLAEMMHELAVLAVI